MPHKLTRYLLLFYIFFIFYNTLLPFQFDHPLSELPHLLDQIEWIPYHSAKGHISRTDIAGNILLFMPLGFLLYSMFYFIGIRRRILLSTLIGAFISLMIEFLQLFEELRNTAPHDFINNTLGSFLGAVIASIYIWRFASYTRKTFYTLLNRKPFLLLIVLLGTAQFFAATLPFTVSITYSDLAQSIKKSNIIPFDYQSIGKLFFHSPNPLDAMPFDYMAFIENILFWAVGGYLLYLCYRIYWQRKSYGKLLLIGIPLLYFPILEMIQLIIVTRTSDINDVISGYMGIALGYLLYQWLRPIRRRQYHQELDLLKIPLFLYFVFILFSGLQPFDWTLDGSVMAMDMKLYNLVPFYSYFKKTSLWDIYDLLNSLTFFLPISMYWTARLREKQMPFSTIYLLTFFAGLSIGLFIEITQVFSPTRVAEITDALAYATGGAIGTFLIYYYEVQVSPMVKLIRQGVMEIA